MREETVREVEGSRAHLGDVPKSKLMTIDNDYEN